MLIYGHVVSPTSTEAWFLVGPSLLDSGHCEKNDHDQHDENKFSAPPLPPIWIFSQLFKHLLEKMVVFFAGRDDQLKPPRLKLGGGGEIGIPSTRSSGWSFFSQWPDLSTRIMSPIFSHVLQIHTWHHRICTYPKQRTTYQVMSIWKTRRMRAKGLADIGFGKPGCRHGLSHERVHKNLHIEPNQDISCPQHTRTLTTPCCLAHPPPLLSALAGVRGIYIPIIPYP